MVGEVINTAGKHGKNHVRKEAGCLTALNVAMERIRSIYRNGIATTSMH
jgi:hypothetical protein